MDDARWLTGVPGGLKIVSDVKGEVSQTFAASEFFTVSACGHRAMVFGAAAVGRYGK